MVKYLSKIGSKVTSMFFWIGIRKVTSVLDTNVLVKFIKFFSFFFFSFRIRYIIILLHVTTIEKGEIKWVPLRCRFTRSSPSLLSLTSTPSKMAGFPSPQPQCHSFKDLGLLSSSASLQTHRLASPPIANPPSQPPAMSKSKLHSQTHPPPPPPLQVASF